MDENKIIEFLDLTVKYGVALQINQDLYINAPVECADVVRQLSKRAYLLGARTVTVNWYDEELLRQTFTYAKKEALEDVPNWFIQSKNHMLDTNACYISVAADDPYAFKNIPQEKITAYSLARRKALKRFHDEVMANGIRWCVISLPTLAWAKTVYPNEPYPIEKMWETILSTARVGGNLKEHFETLKKRAEFLNAQDFDRLIYKSANGTDLEVGLAVNHKWCAAEEVAKDGIPFIANIPSEEVFTAPHKLRVNGVIKNALPLCEDGNVIDDFTITFKDGKIVDYSAKVGYDTLKKLIDTDEGTKYLGEVALIGKSSPIAKTGTLFYNTLFDENASCHLAIGAAYPTCVHGGDKLTEAELDAYGVNSSSEHCDFMIGAKDLSVIGVKKDGTKIQLLLDGDFVI